MTRYRNNSARPIPRHFLFHVMRRSFRRAAASPERNPARYRYHMSYPFFVFLIIFIAISPTAIDSAFISNVIAVCLDEGRIVSEDQTLATRMYAKGASRDSPYAQRQFGVHLSIGRGIHKDATAAVYWWERAAANGDTVSMRFLGGAYCLGRGVAPSSVNARMWWAMGASQGDKFAAKLLTSPGCTGLLRPDGTSL